MKGLNPLWQRSEFAGVSLEKQKEKIRKGVAALKTYGIEPNFFFAPAHTYDKNTLEALRTESNIRIISDTIATKPYRKGDFVFIPQLGGHCAEIKIAGIWTFCLHPSAMTEENYHTTEEFFKEHKEEMIGFDELDLTNVKGKGLMGKLLSSIYFTLRKIRGIK